MKKRIDFAAIGQKWSGWAKILSTLIALAALLGIGGFLYNEVWLSKILTYTILRNYDLGSQVFSGLVIENRGRVPLTDVQIILSDLERPIEALNMPGAHEPADLVSGGVGQKELFINMPRLSRGATLSIYMLTAEAVTFEEKKTLLVTSAETVGVASEATSPVRTIEAIESVLVLIAVIVGTVYTVWRAYSEIFA